jgi:hypothetical protein
MAGMVTGERVSANAAAKIDEKNRQDMVASFADESLAPNA